MKDLIKYYIDLSKLSEDQIKEIGRLITESGKSIYEDTIQVFTNLTHNPNNPYLVWEDCDHAWMDVCGVGGLTELTYPEFTKLFEGGEKEVPDPTAQLEADKEELIDILERTRNWYEENNFRFGEYTPVIFNEMLSIIQKHKPGEIK